MSIIDFTVHGNTADCNRASQWHDIDFSESKPLIWAHVNAGTDGVIVDYDQVSQWHNIDFSVSNPPTQAPVIFRPAEVLPMGWVGMWEVGFLIHKARSRKIRRIIYNCSKLLLCPFSLMTLLHRHPLQFLRQNFKQDFAAGSADVAHARRDEA